MKDSAEHSQFSKKISPISNALETGLTGRKILQKEALISHVNAFVKCFNRFLNLCCVGHEIRDGCIMIQGVDDGFVIVVGL